MANHRIHDATTANVLAWSAQAANAQDTLEDEAATTEIDEPPDRALRSSPQHFQRTMIRKQSEQHESLLTKALHPSDEETTVERARPQRRRSMNSNISLPSTADLTSDTGFTSPARTNTPSPPPPVLPLHRLNRDLFTTEKLHSSSPGQDLSDVTPTRRVSVTPSAAASPAKNPAVEVPVKKRCIQFACAAKPQLNSEAKKETVPPVRPAQDAPRRPSTIKFACPAKPVESEPKKVQVPVIKEPAKRAESPSMVRKLRSPSSQRSNRSLTPRPNPQSPTATRNRKYLAANTNDLQREACRFSEFAAEDPQEEDWIRLNRVNSAQKITINDTLKKENEIRRLGKEAEEEALEEELEEEEMDNEDEDEDEDDEDADELDDEENEDEDEDDSEAGDDEDEFELQYSDGYKTDNEVGFADSESDEEDDEELQLWTTGSGYVSRLSGETPTRRRPSLSGNRSDSSSDNSQSRNRLGERKTRRIKIRPSTPELPDSTDFVCGTLDEDRPAENAYMDSIAARRAERLHPVPQDIDPSFPTSEPDDEEDEHSQNGDDSDEDVWLHGEIEDINNTESDRGMRIRQKAKHVSPKRYRSPPPKRHHSPAPKARGRSPRRLFDRPSPKTRLRSPCPQAHVVIKSPPTSPQHGGAIAFHKTLASRPGLTHTKSLPRAHGMFPQHLKHRKHKPASSSKGAHVRGAIDIVKGLEQKRQRRREKFAQKHCNRARKGQVSEKRPLPGQGAERMRELGLHMAGKLGHDLHVLSI